MTEYNRETFNPKAMSLKVGIRKWEGQERPHGDLYIRAQGAEKAKLSAFVPGHLCKISRAFKGQHDKDPFYSVFISFPTKVSMRGKVYEIPEAEHTLKFLDTVLLPTIYQKAEVQRDALGIPDFEATSPEKCFKKPWLRETSAGSGVRGFFASVSKENIKEKDFGKYKANAVTHEKKEIEIAWNILQSHDLLARPTGIALEIKIHAGSCNIRAKLWGAKVSDLEPAKQESEEKAIEAAASDATEDMMDALKSASEYAADSKHTDQSGDALMPPSLSDKGSDSGLRNVNPSEMIM